MATIRPFKGIRPIEELASKIAALPYDVMNSEEAREMVEGNPYSFLHIDKAEIDLDPSIDVHDKKVYEKARENLDKMIEEKQFIQDDKPCLYIYRQIMDKKKHIDHWNRIENPEMNSQLYGQLPFHKAGKNFQWEKDSLQQMVLEKLDSYMQKNEMGPLSSTTHKNKLKWMEDLNVR